MCSYNFMVNIFLTILFHPIHPLDYLFCIKFRESHISHLMFFYRILSEISENSVDVASLIFVLSAIHPDKFVEALVNIRSVLKSDGVLVFRDYGLHDMAQIRFGRGNKLGENFYVRQDGTRYI